MKVKVLVAAFLLALTAACEPQDVLFAERSETLNTVGTIRELDPESRRFVLRIEGRTLTLRATELMTNFDQLAVGDRVRVQYEELIAAEMALADDTGETLATGISGTAPEGERPGAAAVEVISTVVEFLAYDPQGKRATLRLNDGSITTVKVAREMRDFAKSRTVGDRILVTYSLAAAITVEPAS